MSHEGENYIYPYYNLFLIFYIIIYFTPKEDDLKVIPVDVK